ncbi:hypothetical protein RRG08_002058 [Elysia crispata]|uniref:Uncharacterized protein n=1 Tax=Elysia crispata TaxID=231223 RepID=A0AAE0ZK94_9GAST|nr:hypothetical protein RRG08_002058 [Elysia crispata]
MSELCRRGVELTAHSHGSTLVVIQLAIGVCVGVSVQTLVLGPRFIAGGVKLAPRYKEIDFVATEWQEIFVPQGLCDVMFTQISSSCSSGRLELFRPHTVV